jgi:hypothetical protein
MIMSIGVISIASLFPVALLRVIRATQVTHSTNLRLNAESMLEVYPHLKNGALPWTSGISYRGRRLNPAGFSEAGSVVTSTPPNGRFYECIVGGLSGTSQPFSSNDVMGMPNIPDGAAEWKCINSPGFPINPTTTKPYPAPQNFVVDPLGYAAKVVTANAIKQSFGNFDLSTPAYNVNDRQYLFSPIRLTGNFDSVPLADSVVSLPDNWQEQAHDTPAASTATSVAIEADLSTLSVYEDANGNGVLDTGEDLNGNGALDTGVSRVVLFDITRRSSQVRNVTSANAAGVVTWTEPLPAGFSITDVRVQTQEPQFSWLLSVRRGDGNIPDSLHTDLVTFFRREANNPDDEHVYQCKFSFFGINNTDDLGAINSDDFFTCRVNWDEPGGEPAPSIKKGGFVFDAENCQWYRIQRILDEGTGFVEMRLEERIAAESRVALPGKAPKVGAAMFLNGVVDVYPLGSKK